jgi:MFS family permease
VVSPKTSARGGRVTAYGWFVLALLFVVALFNYVDRNIFSIMQVSVQRELRLTDTQLGTLTGLSFALFYTTVALPVARLADRISRKHVLTVSLFVWTTMTAASSLAGGYFSLLACRIGVAVGEAGCVPSSHSILSDYFPRSRRALMMGVWCLALPFGAMLGFFVGGRMTADFGWRVTFAVVGGAGLLLVPVLLLFLKEPRRGQMDDASDLPLAPKRRFSDTLLILWRTKSYRYLVLGEAVQGFTQNGTSAWNAPFYSRLHHVPLSELAVWLAAIAGLGGAVGTILGGALADRLGRRDVRWFMLTPAIAAVLTTPFVLIQYLVPDALVSLVAAFFPAVMLYVFLGPCNAVSQSLFPADMRAMTAAVFLIATGLFGLGLGPTLVGVFSDLLAAHTDLGASSLRFALLSVCLPSLAAAWLFFLSSCSLPEELADMHGPAAVAS